FGAAGAGVGGPAGGGASLAAASSAARSASAGSANSNCPLETYPCHLPEATIWAKLCRASTVAVFSQVLPPGQPFTLGGANNGWPICSSFGTSAVGEMGRSAPAATARTTPGTAARTAPRTYSTGLLIRLR